MRLAPGLAAALLASRLAFAGEPSVPSAGAVVTSVLPIAGKQVPLPEGPWIVAGIGHARWAGDVRGAYGAIANVVLFRLQGRVVDAALELNVNELAVMDGWGIAADCTRGDLALAVVSYRTGWDGSCFFVTHRLADTPGIPPAWDQALRLASDADLIMASVWLSAGFRVFNRRDVIDARFHFSPSARGIPVEIPSSWSNSAWHRTQLAGDPQRSALVATVARWAAGYSAALERGLKCRLGSVRGILMPGTADTSADATELEIRIAALSEQRRVGQLDEQEFRRQVAWLEEHGIQPGSQSVDPGTAAMLKALSFRAIAAAGSLTLSVVGLGPPSGVLELARAGIDTAVFYLHELGWERYLESPRRDSARLVDFAYFGKGA